MLLQLHKSATRNTHSPGTHKDPISITSNLIGTMKSEDITPTQMNKQYPKEFKHIGYRPAIMEFPAVVQSVTTTFTKNQFPHKSGATNQMIIHTCKSKIYKSPYCPSHPFT